MTIQSIKLHSLDRVGLANAKLRLSNPLHPELEPIKAEALADPGAVHVCIPEHIALQLKLEAVSEVEVNFADGSRRTVPYVGPVETRLKNPVGFGGAIVLGNQVLLGAIPMEDMDLVVIPRDRRVDVNPSNPNIACTVAMGVTR